MWSRIFRVLDTAANRLNWIPLLFGSGVVSGVGLASAWIAAHTTWLSTYGPIAWWAAALSGAFITTIILIGVVQVRFVWLKGVAIGHWQEAVDNINPLDSEFTRRRINIQDLVSPVTYSVSKKRFVDCELIGPANIMFRSNINANGARFINCDIVMLRPKGAALVNVVPFNDIQIFGGTVSKCTIYLPEAMVDTFINMGARFVSLTGRPDLDGQDQVPPWLAATNPPTSSPPSPAPPASPPER